MTSALYIRRLKTRIDRSDSKNYFDTWEAERCRRIAVCLEWLSESVYDRSMTQSPTQRSLAVSDGVRSGSAWTFPHNNKNNSLFQEVKRGQFVHPK